MSRPRYDWPCPKCHVPAGEHCRTLTTNRVTDTHNARFEVLFGWPHPEMDEFGYPVAPNQNNQEEKH